jgi:hypothetical protein
MKNQVNAARNLPGAIRDPSEQPLNPRASSELDEFRTLQGTVSPLDQTIIEDLIRHLQEKPDVVTRHARNESWMTAAEIAKWISKTRGIELNPDHIEEKLLKWWHADARSRLIRPAKYPGENTLARLWGHVERVGRLSESELQSQRTDAPMDLETVALPPDAPVCFMSYAAPDLHFAARVRLFLARLGFDAWIYSRDIDEGELIFEAVQAAVKRAACVIALATPQSLASAWMWTERHYALAEECKVFIVFDGNDSGLMAMLETWRPPISCNDENFIDPRRLSALRNVYAKYNPKRRVEKYESSAKSFLFSMSSFYKCVYPRRVSSMAIDPSILDFTNTMLKFREEWC